jgi:hypothetical protein
MHSSDSNDKPFRQTWILLAAVLLIGFSRHIPLSYPSLYNFSPVLAIFLISGAFLKGKASWVAPMTAVLISDLLINPSYGASLLEPFSLITLLSYGIIFALGNQVGPKTGVLRFSFGYGLCSALVFHAITCGFAWWINPFYAKSAAGFLQALTLGEPGYAPAYLFLRNSIMSTIFFSILFYWVASYDSKKSKREELRRFGPGAARL